MRSKGHGTKCDTLLEWIENGKYSALDLFSCFVVRQPEFKLKMHFFMYISVDSF